MSQITNLDSLVFPHKFYILYAYLTFWKHGLFHQYKVPFSGSNIAVIYEVTTEILSVSLIYYSFKWL